MQNRSRIRKRATQTPPSVSVHSKTEFEKFPFLIAFLFPKYSTVDPFSSPDKNGVLKMLLWRFSVDLLMGCLLKVSSWRPSVKLNVDVKRFVFEARRGIVSGGQRDWRESL